MSSTIAREGGVASFAYNIGMAYGPKIEMVHHFLLDKFKMIIELI